MKLKSVILADDVRVEVGNKYTIVGMYFDSIIFPPGTGPMLLPKLALMFVVQGLRERTKLTYRMWLDFGEEPSDGPPFQEEPHGAENDEHAFILQTVPAFFPGPGSLIASLEIDEGGKVETFRYTFTVRRKLPPGGN